MAKPKHLFRTNMFSAIRYHLEQRVPGFQSYYS